MLAAASIPLRSCHCSLSLPLSSLSLSGVVLLNNLFRMTQIAVRGWLTNACIFHCRTVLLMEKHQLLIVPSFSSFSEKHCKSVCAAVVSRFQVPDESTRPPSLTTSSGLTLFEKKKRPWVCPEEDLLFSAAGNVALTCDPPPTLHRQLRCLHAEGDLRAARVRGQHNEREGQLWRQHRLGWGVKRNFF